MKIIYQHDEKDCGAACLSMIAAYHGYKLTLSEARILTTTDSQGTNLYGLEKGAEQIGLYAESLSGDTEDLMEGIASEEIKLPFIALIINEKQFQHFVVVERVTHGGFLIADPDTGRYTLSIKDYSNIWTGYITTFEKSASFQENRKARNPLIRFLTMFKSQYAKLVGILLLSFLIAVIGVAGAMSFQIIIDNIQEGTETSEEISEDDAETHEEHTHEESSNEITSMIDDFILSHPFLKQLDDLLGDFEAFATLSHLNIVFSMLIFLYILQAVIQILRSLMVVKVLKYIDRNLMRLFYDHVMSLSLFDKASWKTGEYLTRLYDTASIRNAISIALVTLMLDTVMVISSGFILSRINMHMFLISLIMVVLYLLIVMIYKKPLDRTNRRMMHRNAMLESFFKESIDGTEIIKASCAEEINKQEAHEKIDSFVESSISNGLLGMTQETLAGAIEVIGSVIVLWIGFSQTANGGLTIGGVISFYVLMSYFSEPVKNLIELQPTLQSAFVAADRLNDILDIEGEKATAEGDKELGTVNKWSMNQVDFRYGNHELVLHDLTMYVNRGEKIAIVGESGSGKTTLAKLFMHFYKPEKGQILADDIPIDQISLDSLRKNIAYISQDSFLFSGTIRSNLMLGIDHVDEADFNRICHMCKLDALENQLPMGLDSIVEENGSNLSGGQRQRIAIARALLRKPQLLIMDEATSNLDTITENAIKKAIDELPDDITCIIIAHRLATIRKCDRIFVMQDGQIKEEGTHENLLASGGLYKEMWDNM